jgi:hypothetical protein
MKTGLFTIGFRHVSNFYLKKMRDSILIILDYDVIFILSYSYL